MSHTLCKHVLLSLWIACLLSAALPELRAATPAAPTAPAHIPTTISSTYSYVWTTTIWPPLNIYHNALITSSVTVTVVEPWTAPPTAFPTTVTQTAISTWTVTGVVVTEPTDGPQKTTLGSGRKTSHPTWVLNGP
ncbi:hypothetical protein F5Y15DRAFT_413477 [Xylariaceae sp. FL0016]|nr:hypothetical protein F5Y15DRAFT_413477 [Xylariaceae sp. FL0016]